MSLELIINRYFNIRNEFKCYTILLVKMFLNLNNTFSTYIRQITQDIFKEKLQKSVGKRHAEKKFIRKD